MSVKKTVVKVMIGGDEFSLRSDRSDAYTRAVADHVDRAMKEVRASGQLIESHKAAILAALAITDDLFQVRTAGREMEQRLSALTTQVSRLLPPVKRPSGAPGSFASSADDG
ncbi:MAG: cell division protein ZapA [Gemmatimonadetes bacterium]|nr:cell division protein ZapA [Gemmatimonadota bacterium]